MREAISGFYRQRYGLDVPSSRIVVTAGASGALLLALGVLVNPGDEWLLPDPGYPCNRHFLRLLEGTPVSLPVNADSDFQPTADALASAWGRNTRGLLVASPANPTGAVVPQLRLAELSAAIADRGGNLVVDEIYHGLTYGFEADTALALDNEVFVINSFSKYFGMTGWRLGWLVAPERHVREIEKLAQNLYIAPSTLAQHAALAAFHPATIAIFEHRRREFQAALDEFLLAQAAYPHPATAFNIAKSYTDLQNYAEAIRWYRVYQELAPDKAESVDETIVLVHRHPFRPVNRLGLHHLQRRPIRGKHRHRRQTRAARRQGGSRRGGDAGIPRRGRRPGGGFLAAGGQRKQGDGDDQDRCEEVTGTHGLVLMGAVRPEARPRADRKSPSIARCAAHRPATAFTTQNRTSRLASVRPSAVRASARASWAPTAMVQEAR